MIKIEKGVPLPRPGTAYPFENMEVGDSFAFPMRKYRSVNGAAWQYGIKTGTKFSLRKVDDETARVWRVK